MGISLVPYSDLNKTQRTAAERISPDGLFLENCNGKEFILYNDVGTTSQRKNMTVLHEIGHCVLDHTGKSDEEEAEAGFFAKYASAPLPLVHRIKPQWPEEISQEFDISYEAAMHVMSNYRNWLDYGGAYYTGYEIRLLRLFHRSLS